jgi:hypothetical protein
MYLVNERFAMPSVSNQELAIAITGVVPCAKCNEVVDVGEFRRVPRQFEFLCPSCAHRGVFWRDDVRIEALPVRAVERASSDRSEGVPSAARSSVTVSRVGVFRRALDQLHDLSLRRRVRLDVALGGAES